MLHLVSEHIAMELLMHLQGESFENIWSRWIMLHGHEHSIYLPYFVPNYYK